MTTSSLLGDLPEIIPVFPLPGALLLPRGDLPLNIFEPRYVQMIEDAMQGDQLIGMIQPREGMDAAPPPLHGIGCVGRIGRFDQGPENTFQIVLSGLVRFDVCGEIDPDEHQRMYRKVRANYQPYMSDFSPCELDETLRAPLLCLVGQLFEVERERDEWQKISEIPLDVLVTSLSMLCPFSVAEKQMLLEAVDSNSRARKLIALLQMSASMSESSHDRVIH